MREKKIVLGLIINALSVNYEILKFSGPRVAKPNSLIVSLNQTLKISIFRN